MLSSRFGPIRLRKARTLANLYGPWSQASKRKKKTEENAQNRGEFRKGWSLKRARHGALRTLLKTGGRFRL